jgi:DNA-binding NtrC family response regulator
VLERAQILAENETITLDDLPDNLIQTSGSKSTTAPAATERAAGPDDLERLERRHVEDVLRRHGGNKVQAAKALGVSRRSLYRLIDKYQLGEATGTDEGSGPATPSS